MMYANNYSIRLFDGWGAVYHRDEKVYENDEDLCYAYVFDKVGIQVEKNDMHIYRLGQAAPTLVAAKEYQEKWEGQ